MAAASIKTSTRTSPHICVVGAGPYGLEAAAWFLARGYRVTVLERQCGVGGDWLRWGNDWSKLQSHRDSYLFSGPKAVGTLLLPSYPTRAQMLEYFRAYADTTGVSKCTRFNCNVTGRTDVGASGKIKVSFVENDTSSGNGTTSGGAAGMFVAATAADGEDRARKDETVDCDYVFAAPGRVNKRRELKKFPGQPSFINTIAYGTAHDLVAYDFNQKDVVILGHGSFAIENARHALECGAASVVLLARHDVVVMSRTAGLFVDRNVDKVKMPTTIVLKALWNAHKLIGRSNIEELEALLYTPSRTMYPTSDFYFAARASGKLTVVIGEVAKLDTTSVVTKTGEAFHADVLIKCVGFTQDKTFDQRMRSDLTKGGRVATFHHSNSTIKMSKTSTFTGGSGGFRHFSPCYKFIQKVEKLPARDLDASNAELKSRVADRVRSQPLEAFLAEQVLEWNDYCKALFTDGVGIAYPYTLADMQQWEDALLLSLRLQKEGHGGGSSSTTTQGDRRHEGGSSRCE